MLNTLSNQAQTRVFAALLASGIAASGLGLQALIRNIITNPKTPVSPDIHVMNLPAIATPKITDGEIALNNLGKFGKDFADIMENLRPGPEFLNLLGKIFLTILSISGFFTLKFLLSVVSAFMHFLATGIINLASATLKGLFHILTLGLFKERTKENKDQAPVTQNTLNNEDAAFAAALAAKLSNKPNSLVVFSGVLSVGKDGKRTLLELADRAVERDATESTPVYGVKGLKY